MDQRGEGINYLAPIILSLRVGGHVPNVPPIMVMGRGVVHFGIEPGNLLSQLMLSFELLYA